MKKNVILLRDNEEYDYIYGVIVLKENILDMLNINLLQKRLDDMRDVLDEAQKNGELENIDYNGEYVLKRVLESHKEYKDLEYIPYNNNNLEV